MKRKDRKEKKRRITNNVFWKPIIISPSTRLASLVSPSFSLFLSFLFAPSPLFPRGYLHLLCRGLDVALLNLHHQPAWNINEAKGGTSVLCLSAEGLPLLSQAYSVHKG